MVAIIDYDAGNIKSVQKALAKLGQEAEITSEAEKNPGGGPNHPAGGRRVRRRHAKPARARA